MKFKSLLFLLIFISTSLGAESFVNFESAHVSPIDMTPDGNRLLAVNTADNRLEIFDLSDSRPVSIGSVPVGLDPVTVRARTNDEAWVVNHISDSISIVDLNTMNVIRTLNTGDEPADVVFAGTPQYAFVSISQEDKIERYDLADLDAAPTEISLLGEDPRAMVASPDGQTVYVAIFESGNETTILPSHAGSNPVSDAGGPYGGQNPPPNDGVDFNPPINPALTAPPPKMGLIVRKDSDGNWMDDNGADWTTLVSGGQAHKSGRLQGWDIMDNDVAAIDTGSLSVSYFTGMMNLVMAIDVNPVGGGRVTVVGTEATNEIRFEPNLNGRFIRVNLALGNPNDMDTPRILDLNPHLDYSDALIAQQNDPLSHDASLADQSIGDPRAIKWNANGSRAYIAGMGSNNVISIDRNGMRLGNPIEVGEGPTGLAFDQQRARVYVLNKFDATVSMINARNNVVATTLPFFDPTPTVIKTGRKHLYDTHKTSGLGHIACASCHIDSRIDKLAWDLGNPAGDSVPFGDRNCGYGVEIIGSEPRDQCEDFHPMKGPIMTQTLQDIIGMEPLHWRGDKNGLEEFNGAFTGLQGDDAELTDNEMQEFEDFLATIHFPPNPYRNFDNSLPTSLPLDDHFSFGRFVTDGGLPAGTALPNGDAVNGLDLYRFRGMHQAGPGGSSSRQNSCVMCHTLPTGTGANVSFAGNIPSFPQPGSGEFVDNPPDAEGNANVMITGLLFGNALNVHTFKPPQLRNLYDKRGFSLQVTPSRAGFGYFHEGGDTLDKFLGRFTGIENDQETADVLAFLMAFSGSDLPVGSHDNLEEPPGPLSKDAHAAVGAQVTVTADNKADPDIVARLDEMVALADAGNVGLVAHGIYNSENRGFAYVGDDLMQSDILIETVSLATLRDVTAADSQITFTVVPSGSETRIGIDRDEDGILNGSDPVTQ